MLAAVERPTTPADHAPVPLCEAVGRLHAWLETMRGPVGYGGPVPHWWQSSLIYCGPMHDWRYEGVIGGYLALARAFGDEPWLTCALRAGDDLLVGQADDGSFFRSSFEYGPRGVGTPHEAAAAAALLELADFLRRRGNPAWTRYLAAAERNLVAVQIGRLWGGAGFVDQPDHRWPVANKNATTIEALLRYNALTGAKVWPYIEGAAAVVLGAQLPDGPRAGATVHLGTHGYRLSFGIYTARCLSAIVALHEARPREAYLRFMRGAVAYLGGLVGPESTLLGHYADGGAVAAPRWVSPSGDLLRALLLARAHVPVHGLWVERLTDLLLRAQLPSGGLPTAHGFAARGARRPYAGPPELRDMLPAVGWCDKAFRALAMICAAPPPAEPPLAAVRRPCIWRRRTCTYHEDAASIALWESASGRMRFRWRKGTDYPELFDL